MRLTRDGDAEPDVTYTVDGVDFLRLVSDNSAGPELYMTGRITIEGDLMLGAMAQTWFRTPGPRHRRGRDRPRGRPALCRRAQPPRPSRHARTARSRRRVRHPPRAAARARRRARLARRAVRLARRGAGHRAVQVAGPLVVAAGHLRHRWRDTGEVGDEIEMAGSPGPRRAIIRCADVRRRGRGADAPPASPSRTRSDHRRRSRSATLVAADTVLMPGVYDALTARIAARVGFDIVFISGYSVSAARLGEPDFGFLTQTEMAEAARAVCRVSRRARDRRRRHRLRQRGQRDAHRARLPGRGRRRRLPRGPGLAEEVRPLRRASR